MKRYNVEGSWPALVTPFTERDEVNHDVLRRLVNFHAENRSNGILLMGSTGEAILLSKDEREKIIDTVIDEASGKVPVMVGVAAVSTRDTLENARYAREAGADCGLMVQPPYIKPTQDALYHYFKDVADAVDLPLVIYNNPERCGVNVEPETIARLAQHPNIVAIKEAGPNPYGVMRTVELTRGDFNVLCCDCAFYALIPVVMSSGGKGTSNVTGSLCPREMAKISKPWENYEDVVTMREYLYRYLPLIRMMYSESNPVPLKWALNQVGANVGKPRKPLLELSEANQRTMRQTLERLGIMAEDGYQREYFARK
ncbi:MAG TPA: 4-hydroxy-tetrahydrodipicolinate synthase [Candidatus Krumholzibacteriaceae bacterium]|nr:4-hydroxy-tetrahydrodipicolinate synthase [Candidatus Krumholzibacteriaceae bacterium]